MLIPITKSIGWDPYFSINGLIAGARNSGKSWLAMYLTTQLASLQPNSQIFAIDYKQSDIARWDNILPSGRVASSKTDILNLLRKIVSLMHERQRFITDNAPFGATAEKLGMSLYYLVYDEMAAYTAVLTTSEKKEHDALLLELTLLGRQFGFGVLLLMQQASVTNSGLSTSIKEQMGLTAHMGKARESAYRLTFGDNTLVPNVALKSGEGLIWIDGNEDFLTTARPFAAPLLQSKLLWDQLSLAFSGQTDDALLIMTRSTNR